MKHAREVRTLKRWVDGCFFCEGANCPNCPTASGAGLCMSHINWDSGFHIECLVCGYDEEEGTPGRKLTRDEAEKRIRAILFGAGYSEIDLTGVEIIQTGDEDG